MIDVGCVSLFLCQMLDTFQAALVQAMQPFDSTTEVGLRNLPQSILI